MTSEYTSQETMIGREGAKQGFRQSDTLAASDNLKIVRSLMNEVWGSGQYWLLPQLVAADYVGHLPIGDHYGPDGVRIDVQAYRSIIPDLVVRIDDLFAASDKVIRRFSLIGNLAALRAERPIHDLRIELRAIAIDRIANGQLQESWIQIDPVDL